MGRRPNPPCTAQGFPSLRAVSQIPKWLASGNMWLQRTALLFQLKYKTGTDVELMFQIIRQLAESKEFFIRKAIGWALREYSKTNPAAVMNFVESHPLSNLSKREALKVIARKSSREG